MISKKEFVDFLEQNGAVFNPDLRTWDVQHKNKKMVVNFLEKNNVFAIQSPKDSLVIKAFLGDGIFTYRYVKRYTKFGTYHVLFGVGQSEYTFGCESWVCLKSFARSEKRYVDYLRIYDDNGIPVAKSLWI